MNMRTLIALAESANMTDIGPFYHGTETPANAKAIIANGLRADMKSSYSGGLVPMRGHVYMAQNPAEAIRYACGRWAGNRPPEEPPRHPYGYIFLISPSDLLGAIQPDEDFVGWFVRYRTQRNGDFEPTDFDLLRPCSDEKQHEYWEFIRSTMNEADNGALLRSDQHTAEQLALIGKRALSKMPDAMKLELVRLGANIAHFGAVKPSGLWKIRKVDGAKACWNPFDFLTPETMMVLHQ